MIYHISSDATSWRTLEQEEAEKLPRSEDCAVFFMCPDHNPLIEINELGEYCYKGKSLKRPEVDSE